MRAFVTVMLICSFGFSLNSFSEGMLGKELELPPVLRGTITERPKEIYFPWGGNPRGGSISVKRVDVRYALWTLVGEFVWSFEAKYELGNEITLKYHDPARGTEFYRTIKRGNVDQPQLLPDNDVVVPSAVFDSVKIYALNFRARVFAGEHGAIVRSMPCVMAKSGEWGWDVPGSPEWNRIFTHGKLEPKGAARGDEHYASEERAKAIWAGILLNVVGGQTIEDLVLSDLHIFPDVKVQLGDLLSEISHHAPQALKGIHSHPRDRQVLAMMGAVKKAKKSGDPEKLRTSISSIDRAIQSFGPDVSEFVVEEWNAVRRSVLTSNLEKDLQRLIKFNRLGLDQQAKTGKIIFPSEALFSQLETIKKAAAPLSPDDPFIKVIDRVSDLMCGTKNERPFMGKLVGSYPIPRKDKRAHPQIYGHSPSYILLRHPDPNYDDDYTIWKHDFELIHKKTGERRNIKFKDMVTQNLGIAEYEAILLTARRVPILGYRRSSLLNPYAAFDDLLGGYNMQDQAVFYSQKSIKNGYSWFFYGIDVENKQVKWRYSLNSPVEIDESILVSDAKGSLVVGDRIALDGSSGRVLSKNFSSNQMPAFINERYVIGYSHPYVGKRIWDSKLDKIINSKIVSFSSLVVANSTTNRLMITYRNEYGKSSSSILDIASGELVKTFGKGIRFISKDYYRGPNENILRGLRGKKDIPLPCSSARIDSIFEIDKSICISLIDPIAFIILDPTSGKKKEGVVKLDHEYYENKIVLFQLSADKQQVLLSTRSGQVDSYNLRSQSSALLWSYRARRDSSYDFSPYRINFLPGDNFIIVDGSLRDARTGRTVYNGHFTYQYGHLVGMTDEQLLILE